ncbi:ttll3, partial [Symbiodinium necroappetens]
QDLDVFRYELERMDASVQGTQRTVDRVVGELGRVQDVGDSLRADLEKRLSQQSKMLNVFKMELEVKLVSLENRYDKLSDDLWGEETGLAKVMHDLSHTNEVVTSMSTEFASMKHDKASIAQLQMVQEEVNNFTLETNNNVTALQQTVDRMMADMKAHFQTATNTVAAHNAAMLQEVRTAYQEELHEAAQVRKKVDEFMQSEREYRRTLEDSICKSQAQTEDLVRQVTSEVEEVGKLRRRDRNSQEVEIKAVAKSLATVQDSSQHVAQSLEHLSAVIWTMVQCERAASALDLQDDQDRSKIALMGYKEEQSERPRGSKSRKGRASSPSASEADGQTIINVDERCLSCCGKAQTVLSGFKMACLQYSPAPVVFSRKTYNRSDLLGLREKLLSQVHDALQHGPVEFDKAEIFGATANTTISSGAIVDSLTGQDGRLSKATGSRSSPLSMPPIQSAWGLPRC